MKYSEQHDKFKFGMMASHVRIVAETMLEEFYGERCLDFEPHCICCQRWKLLDELLENPFAEADDAR